MTPEETPEEKIARLERASHPPVQPDRKRVDSVSAKGAAAAEAELSHLRNRLSPEAKAIVEFREDE